MKGAKVKRQGATYPMPDATLATIVPLPYPWVAGPDVWLTVGEGLAHLQVRVRLADLVGPGKLVGGLVVSPVPGGPPGVPLLRKETPQ